MTPEEILKIDAQQTYKVDVKVLIGHINRELQDGAQFVQENDTLLLFKSAKGDKAEFHIFSATSAAKTAENLELFLQLLKKLGYKAAYTQYENVLMGKLFTDYLKPKHKVKVTKVKTSRFRAEVTL